MTILEAAKALAEVDARVPAARTSLMMLALYCFNDALGKVTDRDAAIILARLLVRGVVTEAQIADAARSET